MFHKSILGLSLLSMICTRIGINVGFALTPAYFFTLIMLLTIIASDNNYSRTKMKVFIYLLPMLAFYYLANLTLFYSFNMESTFRFFLGSCVFLIMITVHILYGIMFITNFEKLIVVVAIIYLVFSLIFYFMGIFNFLGLPEGTEIFGVLIEKGIPRGIGFTSDPNFASFTYIFMFFLITASKASKTLLDNKKIILECTAIFLVIATLSRGGAITLFVSYFIYLIVFTNINLNKIVISSIVVIFSLSLFVIFDFSSNEFLLNIIDKRLSGTETGGGRFVIWERAYTIFLESPLWGHGAFTFRDLNGAYFNDHHFAHNTYIEVLVEFGILGFLLFMSYVFSIIYLGFLNLKQKPYLIINGIALLVMMISLSLYLNPTLMFVIVVFCLSHSEKIHNK